ncbi:MAG: hypothetical protein Q7S09_04175 [bacterium]|nr:hypothetical protein [bacterium]
MRIFTGEEAKIIWENSREITPVRKLPSPHYSILRPGLQSNSKLPSPERIQSSKSGDFVKLIFSEPDIREAQWVQLTNKESGILWSGYVFEDPIGFKKLKINTRVEFHPLDIVDVRYKQDTIW